jgi:hypothetical protein
MKTLIYRLNPAVDRKYLVLLAGFVWMAVGIMLVSFAVTWLAHYPGKGKILFYLAGFLLAMPVHHFGFLKLADRNINRLMPLEEKRCLFSFITWKSYLIIVIMVSMGIALRHSAIPKQYLSVLYNGIGLGLFLSGIRYIRISFRLMFSNRK